jgi:hypothetical protein
MPIEVLSNKQIDEREKQENATFEETMKIGSEEDKETTLSELAMHVKACWDEAKTHKEQGAEKQILANMRQIEGMYPTEKLAAIKRIGGSEVFMMITDAKCKNAEAWVHDLLFQPAQRPWSISPTPLPDLPDYIKEEVYAEIMSETMMGIQEVMQTMGPVIDPAPIIQAVQSKMPEIEDSVRDAMADKARQMGDKIELVVHDKLTEGKWYDALNDCIPNIIMHTGFLKGPILRKCPVLKVKTDKATGKLSKVSDTRLVMEFESRHPRFIYPAPGATDLNDGYLIDRIQMTPLDLQSLLNVPGYRKDEIEKVLSEYEEKKLGEWLNVDRELSEMNKERDTFIADSDRIDCLEFWGAIKGKWLQDYGVKKKQVPKEDHWYPAIIYYINGHIIKASFNKDPLGRNIFYKSSFENKDGVFWGRGLPEVIADVQSVCNAAARAIVNNVGIASGPQVERNIDRIPPEIMADKDMVPWKVWDVNESTMSSAPALTFYQPPMVVEKLLQVYTSFSKIADEHSGVPAYAHGDPQVGGAGNTASGLSMLMGSAAKGIRSLVSKIDHNIIAESVKREYEFLVEKEEFYGLIVDYEIVASGSTAALMREQQSVRRNEFLNLTSNPLDIQIVGLEFRRQLLEEQAKYLGFDTSKFPKSVPQPQMAPQEGQPGALPGQEPPPEAPAPVDAAGNPGSGQDTRTFNQ